MQDHTETAVIGVLLQSAKILVPRCVQPGGQMWAKRPHLVNETQPEGKIGMSARLWHLQMLNQMAPTAEDPASAWLQIFPGWSQGESQVRTLGHALASEKSFWSITLRLRLWDWNNWYSVPAILMLDMKQSKCQRSK